ncbi:Calx-beta domain-containing protein [Sphingomonas floccifaciens]
MTGLTGSGFIELKRNEASSETFDSLITTGSSTTLPSGWYVVETGTSAVANGQITAGTGSSNSGDVYSFGASGSSDRALGSVLSSTNSPLFGAQFTNGTGAAIGALEIAYTGEQWRLGAAGRSDRLDFQISFDATSLTTGTWNDVDALDFASPVTTGTTGALDGNAAANRTAIGATVQLASLIDIGKTFWIRWKDSDASGSDDGLAIDNVSIKAIAGTVTPPPPTLKPGLLDIADASLAEGQAGVQDMIFKVTRSGGSDGAVAVSYTVVLGSGAGEADATDLGAGIALAGTVTFADGQTTADIRVPIRGDASFEPNETFAVRLSDPTGGATLGDAVAVGTITNDDAAPPAPPANVFINEIHYDNAGADVGEAIEIAGVAGTNLSGYRLVLYNGSNLPGAAPTYGSTVALSGVIDDEGLGYGALAFSFPANGLQNGEMDGVALIAPDGTVVQLLSYEGVFTAAPGTPAAGVTSTDIGVSEGGSDPVGQSLQLGGQGASGADFAWQGSAPASFGSLNPGQTIIPDSGTGLVSAGDASVKEGDDGTANLVFTVRRAGGLGSSASVDYAIALNGTADAADLGSAAVLRGTLTFAAGASSATVMVPVRGDTVGEANETLSLTLSNPVGKISIVDGSAIGTIVNDDPIALSISAIQGAGHRSAYEGQSIVTNGVVTAVDTNGFFLQSAVGDGDAATSDAIFVFTGTAPAVAVGDEARVSGIVSEFLGGAGSLTVTQITTPQVAVVSQGNALPAAVLIGVNGVLPPSQVIDNDGLKSFDPTQDGIDFWESLEGMRVTLDTPQAVSNTSNFGETDVVVSHGVGATGMNDRGGITIAPNVDGTIDYNPEKIQIDDDSGVFAGFAPNYTIGDRLSNVTGVVNYAFGVYEVVVTEAVTITRDATLEREVTGLRGDANFLSLATYNVENLDPGDGKFTILASDIVYNLRAPDILALQEIQDADGAGTGSDLSGTVTAQGLIDAIFTTSGLRYAYVEVAPTTAGSTGGEPGGNIRNGYLYNLDRVSYVTGSAELITADAFANSRKPLVAQFEFAGQTITTINIHFTSRGGSDALWGSTQPPTAAGDAQRTAQAEAVKAYVNAELATDPKLNMAVLGDFNGFYFENALTTLTDAAKGGVFTNLNTLLPAEERYSYMFEGNAQQIDNILVTGGLMPGARYDAVHLNSQFGGSRLTDHDPQVALLFLGAAPTALALSATTVAENLPAGAVVGTLSAKDTANDTLTYTLVDNAGGRFAVDARTGVLTTTAAFDYEANASFAIVGRATDTGGLSTTAAFTVAVTNVNEAPVAVGDRISVNEDATSANLWSVLLGNDRDPDAGPAPTIRSVDVTGTRGSVVFDPASQSLRYVADGDSFDGLVTGTTTGDRFTYTIVDAGGLTSTATVDVTVTAVADGVKVVGGNGAGSIIGTEGEDYLAGGNGADTLTGLAGHDLLVGGNGDDRLFGGADRDVLYGDGGNDLLDGGSGNDVLFGGKGSDTLTGGSGADRFHFAKADGADVITDFNVMEDRIVLDGVQLSKATYGDVNRDGIVDVTLQFTQGASVTLLGVSDVRAVVFVASDGYSDFAPALLDRFGNGFAPYLPQAQDLAYAV